MLSPEAEASIRAPRWFRYFIAIAIIIGFVAVATVVTDAMSEEGCGGG
jgi:hypothetical protein